MFRTSQPSSAVTLTIGALLGWIIAHFGTPPLVSYCPLGSLLAPALGLLLLPIGILCGILLTALLSATPLSLQELLGMQHPMAPARRLFHAVLWALMLFLLLQIACGGFMQWLLKFLGIAASPQPQAEFLQSHAINPTVLGAAFLSACVLSPIAEELLYRCLLPQAFRHLGLPMVVASPLVAILFGVAHLLLWAFPGLVLFSLALSYNTWRHDLLQAILIHAGYNLLTLLALLL